MTKEDEFRNSFILDENMVAFIGSGISSNYINWTDFVKELCKYTNNSEGLHLLETIQPNAIDIDTLQLIAGAAKSQLTDSELRDFMTNHFTGSKEVPDIFKTIINSKFRFFLTTNYDTNIEDAYFNAHNTPLDVLYPSNTREIFTHIKEQKPFVFKIHGSAQHGKNFVISYEDYLKILYSNQEIKYLLSSIFASYQVLFIGYGHRDPHICKYLEFEKIILPSGGMRRYCFICKDDFPITLQARLKSLNVSYISVSSWVEVESFLNQLIFSRIAHRTETTKNQYRRDYISFINNPHAGLLWGSIMYLFTGSEIKDDVQINQFEKIVGQNKLLYNRIERTPPLNAIYQIMIAQSYKRSNQNREAAKAFDSLIHFIDENPNLLPQIKSIAYKHAGMFWLYYNHKPSIKYLQKSKKLFKIAFDFLDEIYQFERLDIEKWIAIVDGESGNHESSYKSLLKLAEINNKFGYKKAEAWCRYASIKQALNGGLIKKNNIQNYLDVLEKAFWIFIDLDHLFGVGSIYLLRAQILHRVYGHSKTYKDEIKESVEQAKARAIITRDFRLLQECHNLMNEIKNNTD